MIYSSLHAHQDGTSTWYIRIPFRNHPQLVPQWEITSTLRRRPSQSKKEAWNYGEDWREKPLNNKTSLKINVSFFLSSLSFRLSVAPYKWAQNSLCSPPTTLHYITPPCLKLQNRYLNFYTQLIWEWLFKRDVYNTILNPCSTRLSFTL